MFGRKKSRKGICPSCHEKTKFTYVGTQKGYGGIASFALWNCAKCGSTVAEHHIIFLPERGQKFGRT